MDDRPRYMISVAADLVGMHPQTLRIYEAKGLVTPQRTAGNTRLYSEADLERLRLIQQLTSELGLNLAGVEHVIRLEEQLRRMQRRMVLLEREEEVLHRGVLVAELAHLVERLVEDARQRRRRARLRGRDRLLGLDCQPVEVHRLGTGSRVFSGS